jgi:cytochrome c peroxidase
MKIRIHLGIFTLLALLLPACQIDREDLPTADMVYRVNLPAGFPPMPVPKDNFLTRERVELGKRLFYDPILSRDSTLSCGSCHLQAQAFSDVTQFSKGIEGREGFRNAPALQNLAWHPYFFFDGGVPTLEQQVFAPLDNHLEMDLPLRELIDRLNRDPHYPIEFQRAYGRDPEAFGLIRAIAAYERTLVSGDSPYDRYVNGIDNEALDPAAIRGMELFYSTNLHCGTCHSGFDFTDYAFQNIGLPVTTPDSGRMRVTLREDDRKKYKTPSLRNIALTAPYMHDGSLTTLDAVIDHFASGGTHDPNQSPYAQGFIITPQEKADLIAFLNALTDEGFVTNPEFR